MTCVYFKKLLPTLLLAASVPHNPQTHLEEIMCDADLDYLGREDYFEIAQTLKQEWLAYGLINSEDEWKHKQVQFFQQHRYFTRTAREKREKQKAKHLQQIQYMY